MTDEMSSVFPVFISANAIVLVDATAARHLAVGFDGPGRAEIAFTVESSEFTSDEYFVSTRYEVALLNEGRTEVGRVASTFLIAFSSDLETDGFNNQIALESLQLAAAEALHPYHRDLLTQLSERFDIPAYRLDPAFDRDMFTERLRSVNFEEVQA